MDLSKDDPLVQRWRDTFVVIMVVVFFPLVYGTFLYLGCV
jgi:hypothetical protein